MHSTDEPPDDDSDPASQAAPLQPAADEHQAIDHAALANELAKTQDLSAAQRLQRLTDHDIVLTLQLQRFDPQTPEWRALRDVLIEYGYAVVSAWLVTGRIRPVAARQRIWGLSRLPEQLKLDEGDAHDLTMDLLEHSVEAFG